MGSAVAPENGRNSFRSDQRDRGRHSCRGGWRESGVVAVAGVAYAAWQTLRADDELWVSDEVDDEADATVEAVTAQ